jgi:hypothetical protein
VCSVMWGSAQADRSIIASGSLPRTPSPAFGLGPRLFRASAVTLRSRRGLSRLPPEPPDPRSGPPPSRRTRRSSDQWTPLDGIRRRSSSEPRPPASPRVRTPGSSEPGRPLPAPATHSTEAGPAALRNGGPTSWDPATELFGAPPSPVPGFGPPVLRNRLAPSAGIGLPPFGARSPLPRLVARSYAPRVSGDRGRCGHRFRPALPHRAGRQRQDGNGRSDAFPAADEGNSSEGAKRTAGTVPCTRPPSGDPLQACTKRGEPSTGCGVQQTRNSRTEKTVEVVRNHKGGT